MEREKAEELLNSLFGNWSVSLVRYAYQLTWSRDVAEDLVQEAFMALYVDLRRGKEIGNLKAWVLATIRNLAHRGYRDRRRHGEVLEPGDMMDTRCAPAVEEEENKQSIQNMLSVLTPREAEVMMLRMQVLKYREIAAALNISEKSVATLLARGLRKLQLAAQQTTARKTNKITNLNASERRIVGQTLQ